MALSGMFRLSAVFRTPSSRRFTEKVFRLEEVRNAMRIRNPDFYTHIDQSERLMGQEAGLLLRKRLEQNDMGVYHSSERSRGRA